MYGGTIRNCRVNAKISSAHSGGGLVAELYAGRIEYCTAESGTEITASTYAGGIVGLMHGGYIASCSSSAILNQATIKGGIVGGSTTNASQNLSGNTWPDNYPQIGVTSENLDDDPEPVPDDPLTWNGHRYQLFSENLTWVQAKSRCEALGGHLATITSQAEQSFIASLLAVSQDSYWIGGYADESGWWHWTTNEPFEQQYQNYAEGQPDGSGGYLMILESGKWDDVRSEGNSWGFICEWDNAPKTVKVAPTATTFLRWLAESQDQQQDDDGYLNGAVPSPIDMTHLKSNPPKSSAASYAFKASAFDSKFDGRTAFNLPDARDQGKSTNTCWAFASIAAMEASYLAQKFTSLNGLPDFSELQVVWSVMSKDLSEPVLIQKGTQGEAISFLLNSPSAPISESVFQYRPDATNESISAEWHSKTFTKLPVTLTSTANRDNITEANMDIIKQDIISNGGVFCKIRYEKAAYSEENHSYYLKSDAVPDHAIFIAGWDDNYSADLFVNTPPVKGAWLVRNSRGTEWGDNGYFWLSYAQGTDTDRNIIDATVFIVSEDKFSIPGKKKNEYDENGKIKVINSTWSANIFRSDRDEDVVQVSFPTTDNNAEYKVFVNTFGKNAPSSPGETDNPLMSGVCPSAGDHTLTLPVPVELYSGDYYAVIVKITHTSEYDSPTAVEGRIGGYVIPTVGEKESFFATGEPVPSVWQDGKYIEGGPYNACIKTITVPRTSRAVSPLITTQYLPDTVIGEFYTHILTASGFGTIEWRCGNVPEGMALSRQGVLSGTPTATGEYTLTITAFNEVDSITSTLTLRVVDYEPPDPQPDPFYSGSSKGGGGCNYGVNFVVLIAAVLLCVKVRNN